MTEIIEFMFLRKSDLELFGYNITKSEWDEIIVNLSWANSCSYDSIFWIMKESNSYLDFIKRLIETKGTFPDCNGVSIQQKVCKRRFS
jgi:hypothetical protein